MALEDSTALASGTAQTEQTNTGAQAAPDPRLEQDGDQSGAAPPAAGEGQGGIAATDPGREPAADPDKKGWIERYAGDDPKKRQYFSRFKDEAAAVNAGYEAQQRLRSLPRDEPFPEKGTPEQIAEWRKGKGIPEKADDYDLKPDGGIVFGEADKPAIDLLKARAHQFNWTPQQASQAATIYADFQEQQRAALDQLDASFGRESQHELIEAWGRDTDRNLALIKGMFEAQGGPGLYDQFSGARLEDGRRLGNSAAMVRMFDSMRRVINPVGSLVPAGVADEGKHVETRLAEIKGMIGDQSSAYWSDPKIQKEYHDLLTAKDLMSKRG